MTIQHSDQLELPFSAEGYERVTWINFKGIVEPRQDGPLANMINSFYWDSTPQGFDYWCMVHEQITAYEESGIARYRGDSAMAANILGAFSFNDTGNGWDYWQLVVSNLVHVEQALRERYPGKTWYKSS